MDQSFQVIFLTPGFAADESDTSCIPALQDFVLGWKEFLASAELKIISFEYPHKKKKYTWHRIPVYAAGGANKKGINKLLTWRYVWQQLRSLMHNRTIIISYFLTESTFIASLFSRFHQVKVIGIAAGQDAKRTNRYLKWIARRNIYVVALSEKLSGELTQSTGKPADHVIPMGMRTSLTNTQNTGRFIDILSVGSLIPLKQVYVAIEILHQLSSWIDSEKISMQLKAEIIGDGPEKQKLQSKAAAFKLQAIVSFTGELKREDVFQKMSQSKILLHTSSYEGQATVITEALSYGMTIVCFDVGRIGSHPKIYVCRNKEEMLNTLKRLLKEDNFDFNSVIPVTMENTIRDYIKIIEQAHYHNKSL